jgi:hypothetical protein
VPELDERLSLRSTAQEVFESDPAIEDIALLGWLGVLTIEGAGGEGWFPHDTALIPWKKAGTRRPPEGS